MASSKRASIERALLNGWQHKGLLARSLWPLSLIHQCVVKTRRTLYERGTLKSERLGVPVIVVGNVIAGGAGKTPITLAVAEHLRAQGWRPGIISRGYGRKTTDCREALDHSDPLDVGDEPLLLRRRTQLPVFVAARRAQAGRALLQAHPLTDVLICDDGLQHRALARDVEICVFDARVIGNGWLLPAGPLREKWPRPVDLTVYAEGTPPPESPAPAFGTRRALATHAVNAQGERIPLSDLRRQPVVALAGIAQPEAFFDMLRSRGLTLSQVVPMADHDDFAQLPDLVLSSPISSPLLCTEKDAAKLWRYRPDAWAVPLVLETPIEFFTALDVRLAPFARLAKPTPLTPISS